MNTHQLRHREVSITIKVVTTLNEEEVQAHLEELTGTALPGVPDTVVSDATVEYPQKVTPSWYASTLKLDPRTAPKRAEP